MTVGTKLINQLQNNTSSFYFSGGHLWQIYLTLGNASLYFYKSNRRAPTLRYVRAVLYNCHFLFAHRDPYILFFCLVSI